MEHTNTVTIELSERATAEVVAEFSIRPGMRASWDDAGWPAELDWLDYTIAELRFASGTVLGYNWLKSRGFLGVAKAAVSLADVENGLGDLGDYSYDE